MESPPTAVRSSARLEVLMRCLPTFILSLIVAWPVAAAEPPITAAAFVPDGSSIIVGSQRGLEIHSWPDLKLQRALPSRLTHIHALAFSPDGSLFVAAGGRPAETGAAEFYDTSIRKPMHYRAAGADVFYQIAWQADSQSVALAGPNHAITVFNRAAQLQRQLTGHSRDVTAIAFTSDGHFVSGSRDNTLRVWRQPQNELLRTLSNHTDVIHAIALRPERAEVPLVLASSSADHTVRFWWPLRGRMLSFIKLPSPALDIAWTDDGATLLAACEDGHLREIDPDTLRIIRDLTLIEGWLYSVTLAPDGTHAFVGGTAGLKRAVKLR